MLVFHTVEEVGSSQFQLASVSDEAENLVGLPTPKGVLLTEIFEHFSYVLGVFVFVALLKDLSQVLEAFF